MAADETKSDEAKATEVAALDKRIADNEAAIKQKEARIEAAKAALGAAQAALQELGQGMKEMAQEQKDQASSLRELQMQMINKVEQYETAKREQAAELVKINALLKGQRSDEETIELAIKSLNLSVRSLKRMREIIVEISFFFKSFADFMTSIIKSSEAQGEELQKVIDRDTLSARFKRRIVTSTSEFFVSQAAEWQATQIVASKFVGNFKDGWSELNRLSGNYLTGEALRDYLSGAADRIDQIAFDREQAARAKQASLAEYRARIAAATDTSAA